MQKTSMENPMIEKLAYLLGVNNEEPNIELAKELAKTKNNRLVWGSMTALSKIVSLNPDEVFKNLDIIVKAYEKGSVLP